MKTFKSHEDCLNESDLADFIYSKVLEKYGPILNKVALRLHYSDFVPNVTSAPKGKSLNWKQVIKPVQAELGYAGWEGRIRLELNCPEPSVHMAKSAFSGVPIHLENRYQASPKKIEWQINIFLDDWNKIQLAKSLTNESYYGLYAEYEDGQRTSYLKDQSTTGTY